MKKITVIASLAAALLSGMNANAQAAKWSLDKAHAKLGFTITHMMVSDVDGSFKNFDASINTNGKDFANASVEMTADVASVNTDNEKRDAHLKTGDFFDAEKYPKITFKSTSFKKGKGDNYTVTGELTMHGVKKTVTLNAVAKTGTNPYTKKETAGFKITGKIKRTDFNVGGAGGAMLGEEVEIVANAEFTKD